ncbi:hypothetical protein LCGC14_2921880 [marine sediment metagenome]|uniref:Uncharacterized protein n=1 Tax=marine sediment metagenome TaxID=412755 RepID=A0A0F9AEK0_9ZZZZ
MGSGGPGNIVHIDNLYAKSVKVADNTAILIGEYLIFDTTGYRPLVVSDFSGNDVFLDIYSELGANGVDGVFQAAHDANNLTTTPVRDRVGEVSVLTVGTDWVVKAAAGIEPGRRVGIHRLDARTPIIAISDVEDTLVTPSAPTIDQSLGIYKGKEFARLSETSVLNDDAIVSTK